MITLEEWEKLSEEEKLKRVSELEIPSLDELLKARIIKEQAND